MSLENKCFIATHNGKFHADDVLAVVLIDIFIATRKNQELVVTRVRHDTDISALQHNDFIVDVGKQYDGVKYFDHHQDKKLPAACKLVWDYICEQDAKVKEYFLTLDGLIDLVSKNDTGELRAELYSYPWVISTLNDDDVFDHDEQLENFLSSVAITKAIVTKVMYNAMVENTDKQLLEINTPDVNGFVFFPKYNKAASKVTGETHPNIKYIVWKTTIDEDVEKIYLKIPNINDTSYDLVTKPLHQSTLADFVHANGFLATFANEENLAEYIKELLETK